VLQFISSYIPITSTILFLDQGIPVGSTIEKINFVVAHWRRGDQLTSTLRCRGKGDTSVNCGSVQRFIQEVGDDLTNFTKHSGFKSQQPIVYICTNEVSSNSINEIQQAGFVMFHDLINYSANELKARTLSNLNSLERFIVEVQLMIYSTHFISFGVTSIHPFVR
jgi:hypothetical protein